MFSKLFRQTIGGVPVITGLPSPLPFLLLRHTSSHNFLPRGAFQFANVSTHLAFSLYKTTTCSQEAFINLLSKCHTCTLIVFLPSLFSLPNIHAIHVQEAVRDLLSIREAIRLVEVAVYQYVCQKYSISI